MKRLFLCGLTAILVVLTSLGAFAQGSAESSVRGNLAGTVVDSSGAIITGAKVTVNGPTGTKSDTTNQNGQFLFPLLTPGFYGLKVEKGSFKTADIRGLEVVTGKTSNVRVGMVAGTADQVVEVQGNAITVDTTSTAVAANLTDTFYQSVPVARGVTGLFYASPGVTSGGGTGTANPSISGGTGLENNYVADGVSITDGGFGGIGVFSRMYGSLSTGINLSFVKEVQVKTGGFEAQYGKSTGGIVQIVTKSGGEAFHGSVGGFFAPSNFEATRLQADDFAQGTPNELFNLNGKILHQSNYDLDAEVGGHVPGLQKKLFFFGSFNPSWNSDQDQYAQFRNAADCGAGVFVSPCTGNSQPNFNHVDVSNRVYSYAAKLTFKANDNHQFETSFFGDPTYGDFSPNGVNRLAVATNTANDKLQFGTRNLVVRYNGVLSPTWLLNASWTWGHNNLNDKPQFPDAYNVTDLVQRLPCGFVGSIPPPPCVSDPAPGSFAAGPEMRGQFVRQGLGYFENTHGDNYGLNIDTSKTFNFLGAHNVTLGYSFDPSHYDGNKARTGATFIPPTTDINGVPTNYGANDPALLARLFSQGTNASFQLRSSGARCIGVATPGQDAEMYIPGIGGPNACPDGGIGVYIRQNRGEFGDLAFKTTSNYHTLFAQDAWSINKFVTIDAGLRWEQQAVHGNTAHYTFTDNWAPRVGISVDPWGNRKTKIYANFGRYDEAMPLDVGIRSLSSEDDFANVNWMPLTDGAGHVVISPDGQVQPNTGLGILALNAGIAAQSGLNAFAPGTRMQYLDEYVLGFEHEFGNSGVIFTARYTDRRIKRIIEDTTPLSVEAAEAGLSGFYVIANPSKSLDIFKNPPQVDFNTPAASTPAWANMTAAQQQAALVAASPATCAASGSNVTAYTAPTDSNGNVVLVNGSNSICVPNAFDAANNQLTGIAGADGIADGFVDPVRVYKSMEFEVNKSFSKNWQLRANYRIAKLFGNYEGSFRNDNGQSDPNISSLFDFTRGDFNLLGGQFQPGVLNTDVRHLVNGYVSYTFGNKWMKGLTLGTSTHFQTGTPITDLYAHPAYANAGEIPVCADGDLTLKSCNGDPRGNVGRTQNWGEVDFHADYPIRLTERTKIRLAADLFNLTDNRTQLRVNQFAQTTIGNPNSDYLKPAGIGPSAVTGNTNPGYERPFYARFGVKFEF